MASPKVLIVASTLLVQAVFGQLCGCGNNIIEAGLPNLGYNTLAYPGINTIGNVGLYGGVGAVGAGIGNVLPGVPGLLNYPDLRSIGSSGPLIVSTISPIGPSGLAVASENEIEGILQVSGMLPFLSAVSFEGALPTAGSGVATCGCGNGEVGILSEGFPGPFPGPYPGPLAGPFPGPYPTIPAVGMGPRIGGVYY